MIDWIEKLPDSMTGAMLAGLVWFGFNYAVLAPRAAEKDQAMSAMPRCLETLREHEQASRPRPMGLGKLLGVPLADQIEAELMSRAMPRLLSPSEKTERCACASEAAARAIRFDYALHTASFRLIEPQTVAGLGASTIGIVSSGVCGALPYMNGTR